MIMAKKNKKGPSDEDIVALAEEMNEVMELDPEIDTDADPTEIRAEVSDNADEISHKDNMSDESWETLEKLGLAKKVISKRNKKAEDEDEDEEEDEDEDASTSDDDEEEEEDDSKKKEKKKVTAKKKAGKTKKAATSKKNGKASSNGKKKSATKSTKKTDGKKKETVIATIISTLKKGNGATKEQIHKELCTKFPDRKPDSMMVTLNAHISAMKCYGGLIVSKDEKGRWSIKS